MFCDEGGDRRGSNRRRRATPDGRVPMATCPNCACYALDNTPGSWKPRSAARCRPSLPWRSSPRTRSRPPRALATSSFSTSASTSRSEVIAIALAGWILLHRTGLHLGQHRRRPSAALRTVHAVSTPRAPGRRRHGIVIARSASGGRRPERDACRSREGLKPETRTTNSRQKAATPAPQPPLSSGPAGKRQLLPQLRRFYPPRRSKSTSRPVLRLAARSSSICNAARPADHDVVLIDASNPDLIGCYETVRANRGPSLELNALAAARARRQPRLPRRARQAVQPDPAIPCATHRTSRIDYTPQLAAMLIYLNHFRSTGSSG